MTKSNLPIRLNGSQIVAANVTKLLVVIFDDRPQYLPDRGFPVSHESRDDAPMQTAEVRIGNSIIRRVRTISRHICVESLCERDSTLIVRALEEVVELIALRFERHRKYVAEPCVQPVPIHRDQLPAPRTSSFVRQDVFAPRSLPKERI